MKIAVCETRPGVCVAAAAFSAGANLAPIVRMARRRRFFAAGMTQHVIQRGNNRIDIFRGSSDYEVYLYFMREAATRFRVSLHSYALMTNHVHLMATARGSQTLPSFMHLLGCRYAVYFNRHHERTGTLFEGRYKSFGIQSEEYWFNCMRYIEQNPVRAGLVPFPADYRWSSSRANSLGTPDRLVTPHPLYQQLGTNKADRCARWSAMSGAALTEQNLTEIRLAIRLGILPPAPHPEATDVDEPSRRRDFSQP